MIIRPASPADLPDLVDLTIEAFRPLFEEHWPAQIPAGVFEHDHHDWQQRYHRHVPELLDPPNGHHITVAQDESGTILGFVGWIITSPSAGTLDLLATRPDSRGQGVARAVCEAALDEMKSQGVSIVHVGTGGDDFHRPARCLYEALGFTGLPVVDYSRVL